MFERLTDCIWRYHDEAGSTSYLVVGQKRAAMIDCGMVRRDLTEEIRRITPLPVMLLLTHAHPDHYGAAESFDEIWIHEKEISALPVFEKTFALMNVPALNREKLHTFEDRFQFELGEKRLTVCTLEGHTPGSTLFVDEADRCIFCGDAVGSGDIVLMSLPMAYDLSAYRDSLKAFLIMSMPWEGYVWYSGHYHQADRGEGKAPNTPCRELVDDMVRLCDALLAGSMQGEPTQELFAPGGRARRACLGRAGIVYGDNQLK